MYILHGAGEYKDSMLILNVLNMHCKVLIVATFLK